MASALRRLPGETCRLRPKVLRLRLPSPQCFAREWRRLAYCSRRHRCAETASEGAAAGYADTPERWLLLAYGRAWL